MEGRARVELHPEGNRWSLIPPGWNREKPADTQMQTPCFSWSLTEEVKFQLQEEGSEMGLK